MESKSSTRVSVVMRNDVTFQLSNRCYVLYGAEDAEENGQIVFCVNHIVQLEKNLEFISNTKSGDTSTFTVGTSTNSIIGFILCGGMNYKALLYRFGLISSRFFGIAVSINEIYSGKMLLVLHKFSCNNSYNIGISNIELQIVSWPRGYPIPKSCYFLHREVSKQDSSHGNLNGCLSSHLSDFSTNGNEHSSKARRPKSLGMSSVSSAYKLFFYSILWLFHLIQLNPIWINHCNKILKFLSRHLYVARLLSKRVDQISELFSKKTENSEDVYSTSISNGDLYISLALDVLLGFLVIYFVYYDQNYMSISSWLIGQKYYIAEQLSDLLRWLMGAPAGLKLNIPLNRFLGNFYIYHVHLWTDYLYFIEIYLPTIILYCTFAGCLGVTFLIALLCDVLSLLTAHIYCFYIYASRLYQLEINVLLSLLRLFTGMY